MRHGRLLIGAITFSVACVQSFAYPGYLTAFKNKYPTTTLDTRLGCTICHTGESYSNNVNCYRKALNQLGSGVDITTRINMLDALDSDGDGVPNGIEATAARPGGGVGFSPGLKGPTGTDPCGANPNTAVSNALETPPDTDGDGVIDALDGCPNDATKTSPGTCGCGAAEVDSDGDGVLDCVDACPGADDHLDANGNGVPDCLEGTTFTVNTTDDTVDAQVGDGICADAQGNCSLRAAVMEANANQDQNTIILPAGTYKLTIPGVGLDAEGGDLDVIEDVNISGAGADVTIVDGNGLDRVFDFGSYQSVINVSGITVTGGAYIGYGGGGIWSLDNKLTIRNCEIRGNSVTNNGDALGGGIFAGGTLVLENSTVSGNSATANGGGSAYGGGVDCHYGGQSTIINSTITGNTITGAIAQGGGLSVLSNKVDFRNCTITGNTAADGGAGIYYDGGGITVFPLTIHNSIIANSAGGSNCILQNGPYSSLGYNIEDADACSLHATGDQINTNPQLGTLGQNGGPTRTQALLASSPAIDAGDPGSFESTDQRGYTRPRDGNNDGTARSDIGAIEYSDCNNNGTDDGTEIANGVTFSDCNGNGIPDACELVGHDCNGNGILDACDADADGDGIPNDCDACPNGGDSSDADGDGVPACLDGCPDDANKTSPGACGCGVPDVDTDGDGVADCVDNCPGVSNIGQEDTDLDGAGDACDIAPSDPNTGGSEPNNPGDANSPSDPNSPGNFPNCGAGACGAGTATLMPFMLATLIGMKRRRTRR